MPDRRKSGLAKPTLVALVVVVAGALAITVALLSGSSSGNSDNPAQNRDGGAIHPVDPMNPNDPDAKDAENTDPLASLDDPFSSSFGSNVRHKVTIRATSNGPARIGVFFRDRRNEPTAFTGTYSLTRTFKSRFPTVQVGVQIYPPASRGSCTVIIDGVQVSHQTTNKRYGVVVCGG